MLSSIDIFQLESGNKHIFIRPGKISRRHRSVDQTIIPMVKIGYVEEDFVD